jgi:hypothetical protein
MALVISKVSLPLKESYSLYYLHSFSGIEYKDSVTIAPGVTISRQSIGVSDDSSFYPYDGILG